MAYLKKMNETLEIDHSLDKVWSAIQKALTYLEWNIEQIDDGTHRVKAKTNTIFMSWSTVILIEASSLGEKTTKVSIAAETPVTTITSIFDFGRTRERIGLFVKEMAKQLAS